jgi:hypothetical protein
VGLVTDPDVLPDADQMTYSIGCPTCEAFPDELCRTSAGWGPDLHAHPARSAAAIVSAEWMAASGAEPILFAPVALDPPWSGGCSPVIDAYTRDWLADALDLDDAARAEWQAIEPDERGLYHLLPLGWTFDLVRAAS